MALPHKYKILSTIQRFDSIWHILPSVEIEPMIGFRSDMLPRHFLAQSAVKHSFPFQPGPGVTPGEGGEIIGLGDDTATVLATPSAVHRLLTGLTPANWRGFCVACGSSLEKNPLKARSGLQKIPSSLVCMQHQIRPKTA